MVFRNLHADVHFLIVIQHQFFLWESILRIQKKIIEKPKNRIYKLLCMSIRKTQDGRLPIANYEALNQVFIEKVGMAV